MEPYLICCSVSTAEAKQASLVLEMTWTSRTLYIFITIMDANNIPSPPLSLKKYYRNKILNSKET